MLKQIMPALRATIVIAVFTGLVFPLLVTILAQLFFSEQANGSLVYNREGRILGSKLIGQQFSKPEYFHPRPSAAGGGYAGEASAGTNLGPTSAKLILGQADDLATKEIDESFAGVQQLSQRYRLENDLQPNEKAPVDAVTRSGSGLDPHISQMNATFQARRVAKMRSVSAATILDLIKEHTEQRQFGIFGEPRVNVLLLNLALDKLNS